MESASTFVGVMVSPAQIIVTERPLETQPGPRGHPPFPRGAVQCYRDETLR
jgi:hypothetical protein